MNQAIFFQIRDFVAQHVCITKEHLSEHTRLAEDLGMDGDDGAAFFEAFSKAFCVNMQDFNCKDHFGAEGAFNPLYALYCLLLKKKPRDMTSITLQDLVHAAEKRHWVPLPGADSKTPKGQPF